MGVWIETFGQCQKKWGLGVTPCMGVWIETRIGSLFIGRP